MSNENETLPAIPKTSTNRRDFMKVAGLTGLAAAGATLVGRVPKVFAQSGVNDFDILNFALNLEYLEAEFYTVATTGKTIQQSGIPVGSGAGPTTGGHQVNFGSNAALLAVAKELAYDEQTHVKDIQGALKSFGVTAVSKPAIKLDALGIGFGSVAQFLTLARAFEDVGVTAYAGAAPLILNKTVLSYAARILAAEALHSGNIRLQVATMGVKTTALDGVDILPPPTGTQYFPLVPSSAMCQVRTPGEVLWIVYGFQANAAAGGFYPAGINGLINTSSAEAT